MRRRDGISLLEVAAATMLLVQLTTIVAQAFAWTKVARRESAARECALIEAANTIERLSTTDFKTLAAGTAEIPLSAAAKSLLPGGRLTTTIVVVHDGPPAKRILVALTWHNRAGEVAAPVRLTAWVYSRPAAGESKASTKSGTKS